MNIWTGMRRLSLGTDLDARGVESIAGMKTDGKTGVLREKLSPLHL